MVVLAADLERGMRVNVDGMPYVVEDVQYIKYGKAAAFARVALRDELSGCMCEREFNLTTRFEVTQSL